MEIYSLSMFIISRESQGLIQILELIKPLLMTIVLINSELDQEQSDRWDKEGRFRPERADPLWDTLLGPIHQRK